MQSGYRLFYTLCVLVLLVLGGCRSIPTTTEPGLELWQRIREGFQLTIPENQRINKEIQWFVAHPEHLKRIGERARPYLYFITQEIERRGLPMEIVLLPAVESAFQPMAHSSQKASGLWQIIPSTGKHLGLKQNWWYDGRRDVEAATHAALSYLQELNQTLNGDWELTLAAYNAGTGNIRKAIRKNKPLNKPTDFWSLQLPAETMAYVPKILALAVIVKDPARYDLKLEPIPNHPYFVEVDIGSQIDLDLAAKLSDIPKDELLRLNPGFNRMATDPDGPHQLQLPINKAYDFAAKLAELPQSKRLQWQKHTVVKGDNLSMIAQTYGTTVTEIKKANKLKSYRIKIGKTLVIPSGIKVTDPDIDPTTKRITHVVQRGETLWGISRKYQTSHTKLARWNNLSVRDTLRMGQPLTVYITVKQRSF